MSLDGILISTQEIAREIIPHIQIYPNPANKELICEANNITEIMIHTTEGKTVIQKTNLGNVDQVQIDLQGLKKGIYPIEIGTKNGRVTDRFVKE